jgi:hypothetical protein
LHPRSTTWFLGVIQAECKKRKWPALQALVINKKSRLPGRGYIGSARSHAAHDRELARVREYGWPRVAPF